MHRQAAAGAAVSLPGAKAAAVSGTGGELRHEIPASRARRPVEDAWPGMVTMWKGTKAGAGGLQL